MAIFAAEKLPNRRRGQSETDEIRDESRQDQHQGCECAYQAFDHVYRLARAANYGRTQLLPGVVPSLSQQHNARHRSGEAKEKGAGDTDRLSYGDKSGNLQRQPRQKSKHKSRRPAHPRFLRELHGDGGVLAGAIRQCYPSTEIIWLDGATGAMGAPTGNARR